MKRLIVVFDLLALILFGVPLVFTLVVILAISSCWKKRRQDRKGAVNRISFVISDLISNKTNSMIEDALLNGYIHKDYNIYLDFTNRIDRFENIQDRIFFYSVAAHPYNRIYNAGFRKVSMLLIEAKILLKAFSITYQGKMSFVKSHDPHLLGLNGLLISRLFRLPHILHMNSDFDMKYCGTGKVSAPIFISRGIERLFESLIISSTDLVMADRNFYKNSKSFPKNSIKKYRAMGVRVDELHYSKPDSRRDLKKEFGLDGHKTILYVGRLHPVKYPEDVVRAFAIIKRSLNDVALLIAGTGILKEHLEAMVRRECLQDSVCFLDHKDNSELVDLYYTADILLAPHGGLTLVESALASTPIVAYDFDWHSEFLENGKMGYIVPFRDVEGLAKRAVEILSDEELRRKMGDYCRGVAEARCARQNSISKEKRIYGELIRT